MKINITRGKLLSFHQELTQYEQGSILFYLLNGKINEFKRMNMLRMTTSLDKVKDLMEEYFVLDEKGRYTFEGEGKDRKKIMQEGKTEQEYNDKFQQLMAEEITVDL